MREAAREGFYYRGQTIYNSSFGGQEVVVIMERDLNAQEMSFDYTLLATKRTSTMEKELGDAGANGFSIVGMTVAETMFGGEELVAIMERQRH